MTKSDSSEKVIDVTVFQTEELFHANGWSPAETVLQYVHGAFCCEDITVTARVRYQPVVLDCEEVPHCSSEALETFASWLTNQQHQGTDANLLLMNANSGGCAYVGGTAATIPAANITEELSYQRTGEGDAQRNIHAALHELAHNLGMVPDYDEQTSGNQHCGEGWNVHNLLLGYRLPWGGRWHRTPCCTGNGVINDCGTRVPNRAYGKVVYHQYYTDCALERFDDD